MSEIKYPPKNEIGIANVATNNGLSLKTKQSICVTNHPQQNATVNTNKHIKIKIIVFFILHFLVIFVIYE